ncbi:hypothetical protein GS506_17080 [Rhodococcus hoagii]|nr:hypothetical protein [Prescottella equi]
MIPDPHQEGACSRALLSVRMRVPGAPRPIFSSSVSFPASSSMPRACQASRRTRTEILG